jgi:hypothetical protein
MAYFSPHPVYCEGPLMDDYKFMVKGKRLDNNMWTSGYFFKIWEQTFILWGTTNGIPNMIPVDPTTVKLLKETQINEENAVLTWGDIIHEFFRQFPGLKIGDVRPNDTNQIYVWSSMDAPNYIATYHPDTKLFTLETTKEGWKLLDGSAQA